MRDVSYSFRDTLETLQRRSGCGSKRLVRPTSDACARPRLPRSNPKLTVNQAQTKLAAHASPALLSLPPHDDSAQSSGAASCLRRPVRAPGRARVERFCSVPGPRGIAAAAAAALAPWPRGPARARLGPAVAADEVAPSSSASAGALRFVPGPSATGGTPIGLKSGFALSGALRTGLVRSTLPPTFSCMARGSTTTQADL